MWTLIIILLVILIPLSCYVTYKETKHHELHKIRAAFEARGDIVKHKLETISEEDEEYNNLVSEMCNIIKSIEIADEE